mmetsp:Transcript_3247/g.4943  ORF Transcript_3247/g.4943 Transcript_3247/m.4943 type:complete len:177 (-) Transcript_3247:98-628(-)
MLKVLQLILIIFSMSYFTGVLWFIKCFYGHEHHHDEFSMVAEFDLDVIPIKDAAIALTYYMFTSLSTVGLGDIHPVTNSERVIQAFMLLFGVMITSFTMENFSLMLKELKNFNESYQDSARLSLFIGTLRRFNNNKPLNIQEKLEEYFHYRWKRHRQLPFEAPGIDLFYNVLPTKI